MQRDQTYIGEIDRLFQAGTIVGLDDGALLEGVLSTENEVALRALVERHGPMVLGVCRRLLSSAHDVEDAFQATFLILVRKVRGLRDRHRLGPWLHGVAYRVAKRARSDAERRRTLERASSRPEWEARSQAPERCVEQDELCMAVDEAIDRLPSTQRWVVVLVDLEGQTQSEAARRLGWSEGAVRGRLARGRVSLRKQLIRRGLAPGIIPGAGHSFGPAVAPNVPAALLETTHRAGMATLLAGRAAPSATTVVSASVAALVRTGIRAMTVSKVASFGTTFLTIAAGLFLLGLVRAGVSAMPGRHQ
jgi:RNA polymerase sigma-70 factor (ECF subfamily)